MKLRAYWWKHGDRRYLIAAESKRAAVREAGYIPSAGRYFTETYNESDVRQALSAPGTVFMQYLGGPWRALPAPQGSLIPLFGRRVVLCQTCGKYHYQTHYCGQGVE